MMMLTLILMMLMLMLMMTFWMDDVSDRRLLVVEDYFHLLSTMARTMTEPFVQLPILPMLMQLSKLGLECHHTDCIERVLWWLRDFFQLTQSDPSGTMPSAITLQLVAAVGKEMGPMLVLTLFQGVTGIGPSGIPYSGSLYSSAGAVLFYYTLAVSVESAQQAMVQALNTLPEDRVSTATKQQFMELFRGYLFSFVGWLSICMTDLPVPLLFVCLSYLLFTSPTCVPLLLRTLHSYPPTLPFRTARRAIEARKVEKLRYALSNISAAYRGRTRNVEPRRKLQF